MKSKSLRVWNPKYPQVVWTAPQVILMCAQNWNLFFSWVLFKLELSGFHPKAFIQNLWEWAQAAEVFKLPGDSPWWPFALHLPLAWAACCYHLESFMVLTSGVPLGPEEFWNLPRCFLCVAKCLSPGGPPIPRLSIQSLSEDGGRNQATGVRMNVH